MLINRNFLVDLYLKYKYKHKKRKFKKRTRNYIKETLQNS
jgi:hypothetical protein